MKFRLKRNQYARKAAKVLIVISVVMTSTIQEFVVVLQESIRANGEGESGRYLNVAFHRGEALTEIIETRLKGSIVERLE